MCFTKSSKDEIITNFFFFHFFISKPLNENKVEWIPNIKAGPMYETAQIADKKIAIGMDTGAYITAMSKENKLIFFQTKNYF